MTIAHRIDDDTVTIAKLAQDWREDAEALRDAVGYFRITGRGFARRLEALLDTVERAAELPSFSRGPDKPSLTGSMVL